MLYNNMNFNSLYKINNKGKIYQWDISVVANNNTYDIVTFNGEKDGKKVKHTRNVPKGKAKRTVFEQAVSEATSKRNSKITKECYTEDLASLSNPTKSRIIRPMLASKFTMKVRKSRAKGITFPCYCQRKLDGLRMVSHLDNNGKVVIESRTGKKFNNFDLIRDELQTMLSSIGSDFYLDGELYTNKLTFETISGLSRKLENGITEEEQDEMEEIEYHIYDCFNLNDMDMSFEKRTKLLNKLFNKYKPEKLVSVGTYECVDREAIQKYHSQFVEEGYEGTMVRNGDSPYQLNKRSKDLQKFKDFMEEEFKIVGFHEGEGDEAGMVVWDCETKDGKVFGVRPRGTREMKRVWFDNGDSYVGKPLTVIFQEYTEYGIPRFPVGKDIRVDY